MSGVTWARELLKSTGQEASPPNLEQVARAAGVRGVVYTELGQAEGFNRPGPNGRVILINAQRSGARQRFTLAHEIAHMYFLRTSDARSVARQSGPRRNQEERICDEIAAELLMPEQMVIEILAAEGLNVMAVEKLSAKASVSLHASAIRICELSPRRAAAVMWQEQAGHAVTSWSTMTRDQHSNSKGGYLPKGFRAPTWSGSHRCLMENEPFVAGWEALQGKGRGPSHYVQTAQIGRSGRFALSVVDCGSY